MTCGLCATFGFVNTWGVSSPCLSTRHQALSNMFQIFQAYYETYTLRDQTPSTMCEAIVTRSLLWHLILKLLSAWIGSVQVCRAGHLPFSTPHTDAP